MVIFFEVETYISFESILTCWISINLDGLFQLVQIVDSFLYLPFL